LADIRKDGAAGARSCVCLAMVVADGVVREEETHKCYILGTFSSIIASQYPSFHDRLHLYVAVTDMRPGEHVGQIRMNYLDDEATPLLETHGPILSRTPIEVIELNFCFRGIVFPKPGALEIAFHVDDEVIQSRKLQLSLVCGKEGHDARAS